MLDKDDDTVIAHGQTILGILKNTVGIDNIQAGQAFEKMAFYYERHGQEAKYIDNIERAIYFNSNQFNIMMYSKGYYETLKRRGEFQKIRQLGDYLGELNMAVPELLFFDSGY